MNFSSQEQTAIARRRAADQAARETQIERLNARIRELEVVNGALGKAIGLLHEMGEQEPDAGPTTSGPSDSWTPKTG